MERYYIYTIEDPSTSIVRYIGYTKKDLPSRLAAHLKNVLEAERGKRKWNKRLNWLKSLLNKGLMPIIKELDTCSSKTTACELEVYWIEQFRYLGVPLVNMTNGGDGGDTFSKQPEVTKELIRKKISDKVKGNKRTIESINKFKASIQERGHWLHRPGAVPPSLGRKATKATRKKQSDARKGKKLPPEQIANMCGKTPVNKNTSKYPEIIQLSLNGDYIDTYKTAGEAVRSLNQPTYRQSGIIRCCKGITNKALGYKWKFKING